MRPERLKVLKSGIFTAQIKH
ncbi:MAG: hypothetical protein RIQ78_787, partial [Bacteroidota bacterium]